MELVKTEPQIELQVYGQETGRSASEEFIK